MTINIHPMFQKKNENMIKIFQNNFIYSNQLCCIENVENFVKKRHLYKFIKNDALKKIECTHLTDVYNVFNYSTNNKEGILYIRGIKQSKYIKTLFNGEKNNVILKCKFNQIVAEMGMDMDSEVYEEHYNILHYKLKFNMIYEQNMRREIKTLIDSMKRAYKKKYLTVNLIKIIYNIFII